MKVTFAEREIELKPTDVFILDIDSDVNLPVITQDEFVAYLAANSKYQNDDVEDMQIWIGNISEKYSDLYNWEGGLYGVEIVRNGIILGEGGDAIPVNTCGKFSKELFEATLAA